MNIDIVFNILLHYIYEKFAVKEAGQMKKIITVLLTILFVFLNAGTISLENRGQSGTKVLEINDYYFEAEFNLSDLDFSVVTTESGEFTEISFKGSNFTTESGNPKLPVFRDLIMFPEGSKPVAEVILAQEKEIFLEDYKINSKIIPAQPSYSKSSLPEDRKFVINPKAYEASGYQKKEVVKTSKSGTMRGVSVGVLEINPVSYDPVRNSLKIYTNLKIRISYPDARSGIRETRSQQFSPYFESAFSGFINYTPMETKSDLTSYPVTYLIAANEILQDNTKLQEFIAWKTQKGFNVITQFFSSSATISTVDTWVEDQYQNLDPKPSFLLIIGDQAGTYVIPTEQNPSLGSAGSVTVSDLLYGVIGATSSSNRIPSIYVGRFSVNNLTELDAQIDKTIWYEKGQFESETTDLSYLSNVLGVAGVDGSFATSHGNPQINYGMSYYFNDTFKNPLDEVNVGINGIPYYYPASAGFSVSGEIIDHVSSGISFYNYTAHGFNGGFGDPSFSISNVNSLTNTGEYPLVVGNCCLTGSFRDTECFGEAWLNVPDKGGIGFIGASMSTYWDEDLAMGVGLAASNQYPPPLDISNPGMYDGNMALGFYSQAGMKHIGLLAVERLGTGMTSSYWSSYHLFGDPSLMVHMGVPGNNTVLHDPVLAPGETFFTVQALKNSYVGITDEEGNLHGAAVADEFGYAVVPIEPFTTGNAHISVTSQFKKPFFSSVPVEELSGPYLILNNYTVSSLLYGTSGTIDIELKNIGVQPSEGISLTASSPSEFISFDDPSQYFGNISEQDSSKISSAISYTISPNINDGETIRIDLTMNDTSKRTYTSYIIFKTAAPVLTFSNSYEGDINPGDVKEIFISIQNSGSSDLEAVTASLSETTGADVAISPSQEISRIGSGENYDSSFSVSISSSIPSGTTLKFKLDITSLNGYNNSYEFNLNAGLTETFESDDFYANDWGFEDNAGWVIDNTVFYAGNSSAKSDSIIHNQSATMSITFEFLEDGIISFYRKVSSETNYDFLKFYIDTTEKGKWSGAMDWSEVSYAVTAGTRKLTWSYSKDSSTDGGFDCAWLDNILATNILVGIEEDISILPDEPQLFQNYPNPFNPVTTIKFSLPEYQNVRLNIYNSNGQLVKEVLNRKMDKGLYAVTVDAWGFNSGTYFYSLETSGKKLTRKMLLMK
jgi:hypothetical protein